VIFNGFGFDFDPTMLRIGSMNMALHGVEGANFRYRDSLAEDNAEDAGRYSLVLGNPPFAGALDYLHPVERITAERATTITGNGKVHRSHVDTSAPIMAAIAVPFVFGVLLLIQGVVRTEKQQPN
jgi:N-6 DNA Methylase